MTYRAAWQQVTCRSCGRTYQCTPSDDYYNATCATDGECERCLMTGSAPKKRNDPLFCDNCGTSLWGCVLLCQETRKQCCSHCEHPEPREWKRNDAPRVERNELVN